MAKSCNQKAKILYLMKLFLEETDEQHTLSRKQKSIWKNLESIQKEKVCIMILRR